MDGADELAARRGPVGAGIIRTATALAAVTLSGKRYWDDLKGDTSGTPTKLTSAGSRTGARLMLHGYLSSLVLLHARFGMALPELLRGDAYFLSLVTGLAPTQRGDAVAAVGETSAGATKMEV